MIRSSLSHRKKSRITPTLFSAYRIVIEKGGVQCLKNTRNMYEYIVHPLSSIFKNICSLTAW
nr:MAG TPA: hypothetical protein [Caudoviricetes sp.]